MVAPNYLVTLLVLILGTSLQQGGAVFVAEGGVAVLPCDLQFDPTKEFAWIKRDHGAVLRLLPSGVIDAFHPFRDRVSLTGSADLDLRIENVGSSPIDWGGPYTCQQQGVPNGTPQELVKALPPDPAAPTITGYSGEYLTAGDSLTLTCVSTGARPPSDLTWWTGDKQVKASSSHTTDSTGQGNTRSELTIPALRPANNSAVLECRANQLALTQVETREVTLNVAFLEDIPTITGYTVGTAVDSGTTLNLTCTSGNSNPAATITWYRDGTTVPGTNNREQPGNHGGMVTSQDQVIVLQPQHKGAQYTCRATNSELGLDRDSSAVGPLNVRYAPRRGLSENTILIIILACVGAAVIIIVAVLVYCCCIKGQHQTSQNSAVAERLATGQEQMGKLLAGIQQGVSRIDEDLKAGKDDFRRLVTEMKDLKAEKAEADERLKGVETDIGDLKTAEDHLRLRVERLEKAEKGNVQKFVDVPQKDDDSSVKGHPQGTGKKPGATQKPKVPPKPGSAPNPKTVPNPGAVPKQASEGQNDAESTRLPLSNSGGASGRLPSNQSNTTFVSIHPDPPKDGHAGAKQGQIADAMWGEIYQLLGAALPSHPQLPFALAVTLGLPEDYVNHVKTTCGSDKKIMLYDILDFWFKRDTDPSPLRLAEALERCKFGELAKEVQDCWQKYNSTGLEIQPKES